MTLTSKILWAMASAILVGGFYNYVQTQDILPQSILHFVDTAFVNGVFYVGGKIFVASLKLLVVPLVLVSLICGCAEMGANARMGIVAGKILGLYLVTTAMAITLALCVSALMNVGGTIDLSLDQSVQYTAKEAPPLTEVLINIFPSNPIQAMAQGNMLQVIVFAVLAGVALAQMRDEAAHLKAVLFELNALNMKMVTMLMALAPYGVFSLLVTLFAQMGFDAIVSLFRYFMTVTLVLALHLTVIYGGLLTLLAKLNPLILLAKMRSAIAFAFSTSSSNATLPVTLRSVEERLGVSNKIASFTVPLGATINMDGTAIMQGVATVFIAQAYSVDIGLTGYLMVILTATLASIGTAGVPGVGLITLAMVLQQAGLPVEGIALIIGVDRLLDMMRTAVNITGDSIVSVIVAKSEKALDIARYKDTSAGAVES